MRGWRAPALACAAGIAAGLWLGGLGMSCTVVHGYNSETWQCPPFLRPECCDVCGGVIVALPICTESGWSCPPPSVDNQTCPFDQRACRTPEVNRDAGACADSGVGPTQELYTFPMCPPQTLGCPNDLTVGCALRTINGFHNQCNLSSDCVRAPLDDRCTGWAGTCTPYVVNAIALQAFLNEANQELARYCGCPACTWSNSCPGVDAGVPRCVAGRCIWETGQVAYLCANRSTGECFQVCAADEACFTQVSCPLGSTDGGCRPAPDGGALPRGDDLCHPRCLADGGCPAGQRCFHPPFFGCGPVDGGPQPLIPICCDADAGCD